MRIILLIFFISFTTHLFSQNIGCGTRDPTPAQQQAMDQLMQVQRSSAIGFAMGAPQEFAIVAHIIRQNDGTGGLSEAQLQEQLDRVNTYYIHANISFFYLDIKYIYNDFYYDYYDDFETRLTSQYSFENTINIYFVNSINGGFVCGYAYFPAVSRERSNNIFISNPCTTSGELLTHELGHFFSLYHTHGTTNTGTTDELVIRPGEASMGCVAPDCTPLPANCATNGDRLCDTEADPNLTRGGLHVNLSCQYTGGATDRNNDSFRPNTRNIMSYSIRSCRNLLTAGQYERMNMTSTTSRNYLHKSRVLADFEADERVICNELSVTYNSYLSINEERYSWSFEGGTPAVSTASNPTVRYLNNGSYDVTLTVSDIMGNEHTKTSTDYITVMDPVIPNTFLVSGSFEENPLSEQIIDDRQGTTWEQTTLASSDGGKSMGINLFNSSENEEDLVILQPFNAALAASFVLSFDYAFAAKNDDNPDTLEIFMRDICSEVPHLLSTISSSRLTTAPTKDNGLFIPTEDQWARETITFSRIDGNDVGEIFFKITRHSGNALYIDNYRIVPNNPSYIDLTASVTFNPYYVAVGTDSATLCANISNKTFTTFSTAATIAHFYRSTDAHIDATDIEIKAVSIPALAPNEISSHTLKFDVPATAGEYYYGVCVDTVVNEAITANNCSSSLSLVYTPIANSQRTGFSMDILAAAGNNSSLGIWSNGITMWVSDNTKYKIYAYDLATKRRDTAKDFNTLVAAGNIFPWDIWSDGVTMWVIDNQRFKIFAYNMATKQRDVAKDFNTLAAGNRRPAGLWSDGRIMWVSNGLISNRIYAYNLADQSLNESQSFDVDVGGGRLSIPTGIWGNDETLWVGNLGSMDIKAYNLKTKEPDPIKDIDNLSQMNESPLFLWSDGITMWVTDILVNGIFAYDFSLVDIIPEASFIKPSIPIGTTTPSTLRVNIKNEISSRDAITSIPPTTVRFYSSTDSVIDPNTDVLLHSEMIGRVERDSISMQLTLDVSVPTDRAGNHYYGVCVDTFNGETETDNNCTEAIRLHVYTPLEDSQRISFNTVMDVGSISPRGIWSDGTTMWVLGGPSLNEKIYAFNLATKVYDSTKTIENLAAVGNSYPRDIWSDGTTMWVSDYVEDKIYAYNIVKKAFKNSIALKDVPELSPYGIWSDGETAWVSSGSNRSRDSIYAYNVLTQNRDASRDIFTEGFHNHGIWSNGTTMWGFDDFSKNIIAYDLATRQRNPSLDFSSELFSNAGNEDIYSLWSDGTTMWVSDDEDDLIYAYDFLVPQTIDFSLSETTYFVGDSISLTASSSSGLPVTLSSNDQAVATIIGNKIYFIGQGTTTIIASQDGGNMHVAVVDSVEITVRKRQQTIDFSLSDTNYFIGDSSELTASASSGLPVTFASNNQAVATITGNKIYFVGLGAATITASQGGDNMYATVDNALEITVGKQTITLNIPQRTYFVGSSISLTTSSASSGLPITFTSDNEMVATIIVGQLYFVGEGKATITASQNGNNRYSPVSDSMEINVEKQEQTLTFNLSDTTYFVGDSVILTASASSGLPVTFASDNHAVATITGNKIDFVGQGIVTITISQNGDNTYSLISDSVEITVEERQQTLTFSIPQIDYFVGDSVILTASASSGLPVTFASDNHAVATITGNKIDFVGQGTATITASQDGGNRYVAVAESVEITVEERQQTLTFSIPQTDYFVGDSVILTASASSGLPVTFASDNHAVATITGNKIDFVGQGTATIIASQDGGNRYVAVADSVEITVEKKQQTLTFNLPQTDYLVGDSVILTASASSGLPVTFSSNDVFSSSNQAVAIITGNKINFVELGVTTITASQNGNNIYSPISNSVEVIVRRRQQTIDFSLSETNYFVGDSVILTASASSGLPVTFASDNHAVASITGNKIDFVGQGTATITASQDGGNRYFLIAKSLDVNVRGRQQTLTFTIPQTNYFVGDSVILTASASSGLPVTFASDNPAVATITGNKIDFVGQGTATIIASQDGGNRYVAVAESVEIIVEKKQQTLTFTIPQTNYFVGDSVILTASTSSGLPVTFASDNPAVASITGNKIDFVGQGIATITASQDGGNRYVAVAESVEITVEKKQQTLTFSIPQTNYFVGDSVILTASASSGLPVTFASDNPAVATITGNKIDFVGQGTATITASQDGGNRYVAVAESVEIIVEKKQQTLTFTIPQTNYFVGDSVILTASASSGLPVTFASDNPAVATITGNKIDFVGQGTATITASQDGGNRYVAVAESLEVNVRKRQQAIDFSLSETNYYVGDSVILTASTSSGLPVTFASDNPAVATITGNKIDFVGQGTATITASQDGGNRYVAVAKSLEVNVRKRQQAIDFSLSETNYYVGDSVILTASASSRLPVTFASDNQAVATINGDKIDFVGQGTATIIISQHGNDTYTAVVTSIDITVLNPVLKVTSEKNLIIYPNPSEGIFYLSQVVDNLCIYDITGRLLSCSRQVAVVDLTKYVAGHYLVVVQISGEDEKYTVIKE